MGYKNNCHKAKLKGQFFILGAVMLCVLFFIGLPFYGPSVQSSRDDIGFFSENVERELPRALNLGLKEDSGPGRLADFSGFSRNSFTGQNAGLGLLWVVSEPQGSGILVTVGNFMGQVQNVTVSVEGQEQAFDLEAGSYLGRVFSGVPDRFQIEVGFSGHSKTVTWVRSKVNLYAFTEIAKGSDRAVGEIEA